MWCARSQPKHAPTEAPLLITAPPGMTAKDAEALDPVSRLTLVGSGGGPQPAPGAVRGPLRRGGAQWGDFANLTEMDEVSQGTAAAAQRGRAQHSLGVLMHKRLSRLSLCCGALVVAERAAPARPSSHVR